MEKLLVIVTMMLLVSSGSQMVSGEPCDPDCSNMSAGGCVADPRSCDKYYICQDNGDPSSTSYDCPSGEKFDQDSATCCTPGTTCDAPCSPNICSYSCSASSYFIPNPRNCTQYYACTPSEPNGHFSCGSDTPYFNGETQQCTRDASVCCEDACVPFCTAPYIEVADPYDCTKYYYCSEVGQPQEDDHFSCSPGQVFDSNMGVCSDTGVCVTLCSNFVPASLKCLHPSYEVCSELGNIPVCGEECTAHYYYCAALGIQAEERFCSSPYVFNPVDGLGFCVQYYDCPYYGLRVPSL